MKPSRADHPAIEALIAEHEAVNASHDSARSRLLDCLPTPERDARSTVSQASWVGLGALASAAALLFWVTGATSPAVAIERMALEVERVQSVSYRMEETSEEKDRGRLVESVYEGKWLRDPFSLQGTMKVWVTEPTNGGEADAARKQTVDVWEAHRANEKGIIVDHLQKHYWRTAPIEPARGLDGDTPIAAILKVSQRRGRELRDLGVQLIAGRKARGVVILLDDSNPALAIEGGAIAAEEHPGQGARWRNERIEVWLDLDSGLPVQFKSVRSGEGYEATTNYSKLQWNDDLTPEAFLPTAPSTYEELPTPHDLAD